MEKNGFKDQKNKRASCLQANIKERLLSIDRFSTPVQLNINGKTQISSYPGACVSLSLFVILLVYGIQKFQQWAFILNPSVTVTKFKDYFDSNYQMNLTDIGVKLAFGVVDYETGKSFDDPNFIKWTVTISNFKEGKKFNQTMLKYHKCTAEDYASFYPPTKSHADSIKVIKNMHSSLNCIDPGQNLNLAGFDKYDAKMLQIKYQPCTPDTLTQTCLNQTLDQTLQYLGRLPDITILQNTKRFDLNNYSGNLAPIEESLLQSIHIDLSSPSTFDIQLQMQQVQDEISLLHFGLQNTYDFWDLIYTPIKLSTQNKFPDNYNIIGFNLHLTQDFEQFQRTNYDFLNFLGDVGGLDSVLTLFGAILVQSYQKFNFYAYLITILYVKSSKAFQTLRSIMKPQYGIQDNTEKAEIESRNIFGMLKQKSLIFEMKQDFDNRKQISKPTFREIIFGWFCRFKKYKQFLKLHRRSIKKVNQELDIIQIIKRQRINQVKLFSLFNMDQHRISQKIAEYVLSENSSSDELMKKNFFFPGSNMFQGKDFDDAYIERVIQEDSNVQNQRLLNLYWLEDQHRQQKWTKTNPSEAKEQNMRELKVLLARNLLKPKQRVMPNLSSYDIRTDLNFSNNERQQKAIQMWNLGQTQNSKIQTSLVWSNNQSGPSRLRKKRVKM